MTYEHKGVTYHLAIKNVTLRSSKVQPIYYLTTRTDEEPVDALPAGYEIRINPRTDLPVVGRKS